MRAVCAVEGGVRVADVDEPSGPGELVEMRVASICGSDFGYIAGGSRHVLGHELAGVDESGRLVAVEAVFGCMSCELCLRGDYNLCSKVPQASPGYSIDGGMADYFRAPSEHLVEVPTGLDPAAASLIEPASVAWHAAVSGGVGPGSRVAVVGGGAIGLLAVVAAQAMGAASVAVEARHPRQVSAAETLGAERVDGTYDVVVEAAGTKSSFERSLALAGPRGCVVVAGVHSGPVELPMVQLLIREVRIVYSMGYNHSSHGRDMADAAAALAGRPEVPDVLITHRFPLEDAVRAFEVAADRSSGAIKVAIDIAA